MSAFPLLRRPPPLYICGLHNAGEGKRCIGAGVSDYISKSVDTEQLLSMLCVWIYK